MANGDRIPLALVALYTNPDADLLSESSDTLWAVVGMVPFKWKPVNTLEEGHITKPGRAFGGSLESPDDYGYHFSETPRTQGNSEAGRTAPTFGWRTTPTVPKSYGGSPTILSAGPLFSPALPASPFNNPGSSPAALDRQLPGYMHSQDRFRELEKEVELWNIKYNTLSLAYEKLVAAIPKVFEMLQDGGMSTLSAVGLTGAASLSSLHQQDYPHVRFWTATSYRNREKNGFGKHTLAANESWTTMYLEDQNGKQADSGLRSSLNTFACGWWTAQDNAGKPPRIYSETDIATLQTFRHNLELEFPLLRLCEHHWKADEVWKQVFGMWVNRGKSKRKIKAEHPDSTTPLLNADFALPSDSQHTNVVIKSGPQDEPPPKRARLSPSPELEYAEPAPESNIDEPTTIRRPLATKVANPLASIKLNITSIIAGVSPALPPSASSLHPPQLTTPEETHAASTSPITLAADAIQPASPLHGTTHDNSHDNTKQGPPGGPGACATTSKHGPNVRRRGPASEAIFEVPKGTTARSLCARQWKDSHPTGTKGDFEHYYKGLTQDQMTVFRNLEKDMKKANKENKNWGTSATGGSELPLRLRRTGTANSVPLQVVSGPETG
ncbi:hypothetical protein EYR40_007386 [Pleurotus pulmonarius]|nr:hypothetical protein EYR40_007386 [Pleurotus pulmonarius]